MSAGLVFDIKKFAIHDGPGIRTTVFFKGCPLRCAWCHNPEGQLARPEVMIKASRCLPGCRACLKACPKKAVVRTKDVLEINRYECDGCGLCADACPSQAIELAGRQTELPALLAKVFQDDVFHEHSGGGVTVSGGEPLMQPDFLEGILDECRRREVHVAVDTCGYVPSSVLSRIAGRVDLFLYDFKIMDDEAHRKHTGVSNRVILDNLKRLAGSGAQVVVRIPLIAGVNDDEDNIVRTAQFLKELKTVRRISLLPYHCLAADKYKRLDRGNEHRTFAAPSRERQEAAKARFESCGFAVSIGD